MNRGARTDWEQRISRRTDQAEPPADAAAGVDPAGLDPAGVDPAAAGRARVPDLPPPAGVTAEGGEGQVTIGWTPVAGAVGYQVYRTDRDGGPLEPVDHAGGDVLAVPHPPYVDTTGEPGRSYRYAVSSLAEVTAAAAPGPTAAAGPLVPGRIPPQLRLTVDATDHGRPLARPWQPMVGSERPSQLLCTDTTGGREIGAELEAALRRVHDEIGVTTVRAHAILHDDTGVYREVDGAPRYDFTTIDRIYDRVLGAGLEPVVELGFMPHDLARDPDRTVFGYRAIISPPKDDTRWAALVTALLLHLGERYGRDRVAGWDVEVWNEANLEVFWAGTKQEWFRFYDVTAAAVKAADPRIAVGGPSSAAAGWVEELLAHCRVSGSPVDFVSTHTYGSPPLDLRATLRRQGFPDARILWTEWGVTPRHFDPVNDAVFSGVFLIHGMRSAAGRVQALSPWVVSDHFEELGRPPRLLHGGFGLLSVGNLPKPRFHALRMLAALGERELPVELHGDGAGGLVDAWAGRHQDGRVAVLVWNLTLNQRQAAGEPALTRRVDVRLPGLTGAWTLRTSVLAPGSGDLAAAARDLDLGDWPTDDGTWAALARGCALPVTESLLEGAPGEPVAVALTLPMPSAVLLELAPAAREG